MSTHLSDQEIVRREALQRIREMGIDPYPAPTYPVNTLSSAIRTSYDPDNNPLPDVCLAGRLMQVRVMGKASFAELQDAGGRIQLYVNRDELCPGDDKSFYNEFFKKLLDIGDFIGVRGHVFTTQTGELTVHVQSLTLLAKSLRPLPVVKTDAEGQVHDAFTDPELRHRQRYVDLVVNPGVRETFLRRSRMIQEMRNCMLESGFLEVETPVLQPLYGGALARPFKTHHNTLDTTLYLRIANELYLKRLVVGGFDGVFEFAKNFRNEGMSRFHNPEFTLVELYVAYKDCYWMMDFVEAMIERVALALHGDTRVTVGEKIIDFKRPWKRYTMAEAIQIHTGTDIRHLDENGLREAARRMNIETDASMGKGKLIDEIFGAAVEPLLIQPTFITDYPVEMSPLAKRHRDHDGLVERFEVICNAKEIANAFSELNDPLDQRERFEDQIKLGLRGDAEAMMLDEDFLRALEYGMPPTAGVGIGIDRLAMIMTNQDSIQEVIFFPQMRPERHAEVED
ncbi:MAG: lysine--tRNA ligase [Saprospiraceae bacterium]|nr:lysine--tRNA ligase [Saprospiraceae bacterium]